MNDNPAAVTRNLRELLKALPAVRERCDGETVRRHLAMIAHFRGRLERLASARAG